MSFRAGKGWNWHDSLLTASYCWPWPVNDAAVQVLERLLGKVQVERHEGPGAPNLTTEGRRGRRAGG